jgi:hypothetical protein
VSRLLALLLLIGSLLLLCCAALHPVLPLDAAGDLAMIAGMPHWRFVHLGLLYATGLCIAGVWSRWLSATPDERPGLAVAFAVLGIGLALNGVNIAYMTGAGTRFAALQASGTDVRVVYEALHLSAIMAGRLGGFLVAIAAGLIAWCTWRSSGEPRWLPIIAGTASVAGLAGNLFAPPGHPLMLTSVGVLAVWQVGTGVRGVRAVSRQP